MIFAEHNKESLNEWDIMKDCDRGKTCLWSGTHRHVMTSVDYNSVKQRPHVSKLIFTLVFTTASIGTAQYCVLSISAKRPEDLIWVKCKETLSNFHFAVF